MESAEQRHADHFETLAKQSHAARLGMWIFLSTEVLLFAGLFVSYTYYRYLFFTDFVKASHHLKTWIGTTNTFILLTSSLTVALAVHFARHGRGKLAAAFLAASIALGLSFMGFKALEYWEDVQEGMLPGRYLANPEILSAGAGMFFTLYWIMTALHALHVTAGLTVLTGITVLAWRGVFSKEYDTPIELGAMYWHLVDLVWIFLWPLLYLVS